MADDPILKMPDEPYDDVPRTNAIVKTEGEAHTLARRMAGEIPPNFGRFHCITCGWNNTLEFTAEEMDALGQDVTKYKGECPDCSCRTLVIYDALFGAEMKSIDQRAREGRREEFKEQADVLADRFGEEVRNVIGAVTTGNIFDGAPGMPTAAETSGGTTKATEQAERTQYPDAPDPESPK